MLRHCLRFLPRLMKKQLTSISKLYYFNFTIFLKLVKYQSFKTKKPPSLSETMAIIIQNFKFCYLSNDAFEVAVNDASINDVSPPKIR